MVRMILIGAALVVMAEFRNSLDPDSMGFFGEESV